MNDAVKQIIDKLETLAPQAQELFGRMAYVYAFRIYTLQFLMLSVAIVGLMVWYTRRHYDACDDGVKTMSATFAIMFGFFSIVVFLFKTLPFLIDPQAAYIMHLLK